MRAARETFKLPVTVEEYGFYDRAKEIHWHCARCLKKKA